MAAAMRVHARFFDIAGVVLVLALLGGCHNGDDAAENAAAEPPTGAASNVGSGDAPAGPRDTCPLTAAEVGDAVGVPVQQDATICMFEPEPGKEPSVMYVRQVPFACSDSVVKDPSFTLEPYDSLGVQAYVSPVGGDLLVCTDPPFEITVNVTPDLDDIVADSDAASAAARASERAAAQQLARRILSR